MDSYVLFYCSEWHSESEVSSLILQQQLDESNAKLLEQFKNSSRRVKQPKIFTADKLSKPIWFHLVVAVALFYQTLTLF